jgi:hypothetical protein
MGLRSSLIISIIGGIIGTFGGLIHEELFENFHNITIVITAYFTLLIFKPSCSGFLVLKGVVWSLIVLACLYNPDGCYEIPQDFDEVCKVLAKLLSALAVELIIETVFDTIFPTHKHVEYPVKLTTFLIFLKGLFKK